MHKRKASVGTVLYRTVGVLFVLVMLSVWMLSGLFAKYVTSGNDDDAARVAGTGVVKFEVKEHEAKLESGVYVLKDKDEKWNEEVDGNSYTKVLPGVDIPKDPFVRLVLKDSEVDYELYLKVTEVNFPTYPEEEEDDGGDEEPDAVDEPGEEEEDGDEVKKRPVTYTVEDVWKLDKAQSDAEKGVYVYKYNGYFDAYTDAEAMEYIIPILVDDKIYVSQYYDAQAASKKGETFSLKFEAWLKQVD